MSTSISSRILRSAHSDRLQTIPLETLFHILSFCDQSSLVALSLVSFECWELAGPILYKDVEIRSVDALVSLLFLEDVPPSQRLRSSPSLLSRIRTLTLLNPSLDRNHRLFYNGWVYDEDDDPFQSDGIEPEPIEPEHFFLPVPHRLLRFSPLLHLENLVFFDIDRIRGDPIPLFHLFSPKALTLQGTTLLRGWSTEGDHHPHLSLFFVRTEWTDLERISLEGKYLLPFAGGDPIAVFWARARAIEAGEERWPFELRFDFRRRGAEDDVATIEKSGILLQISGVSEEMLELVDLRVVVVVNREDEEKARKTMVATVGDWLEPLLELELV